MNSSDLSRRSVLHALALSLGVASIPWPEVARAAHDAHAAAQAPATSILSLLSTTDAADIEALTAQIIPTDGTPGADRHHRSHDVPNLFICDGSSLVTSGRGQPTMTIQALAFRAGEHIAGFAKRGEI